MIPGLANAALVFAATGAVTFVFAYHLLAAWRESAIGRNVMSLMALICALLLVGVLRNYVRGIESHSEVVRLAAYVLIGSVIWRRVFLLIRAQRRQTTRDEERGNQ